MSSSRTAISDLLPNIGTAIANLQAAFGNIQSLVAALAYVIGLFFIIKGMLTFKGATGAQAQGKHEFGPALLYLIIGTILLYLPSSSTAGLNTIFGTSGITAASSLIGYSNIATTATWSALLNLLQQYIGLIGWIAFIRGWIILAKVGHAGGQPGNVGKAVTHIIAGVLLANIVGTLNILATTFGISR